ncbi:hypothetical protein ACFSO7_12310 [Bacillus sp. CGMCC 1.16607]|uniref:hypothetical protein n=1 Tax=Bacillus sp. CGMCC 1.16607 TaxID=3351842 RepID=UPI003627143D
MKLIRQNIIYILLGLGMLFFFTLWVFSERDNKTYEQYLSDELVNKIVHITGAPQYAIGIIQDVLSSGEITNSQAEELQISFHDIAFDTQEINQMDNYFNRLENYSQNQVISINNDYSDFFMKLNVESDKVKLSKDQLEKIKKMESLLQKYNDVVNETLLYTNKSGEKGQTSAFWDYYREQGFKDDYWVDLLKGYGKVTDFSYRIN